MRKIYTECVRKRYREYVRKRYRECERERDFFFFLGISLEFERAIYSV